MNVLKDEVFGTPFSDEELGQLELRLRFLARRLEFPRNHRLIEIRTGGVLPSHHDVVELANTSIEGVGIFAMTTRQKTNTC